MILDLSALRPICNMKNVFFLSIILASSSNSRGVVITEFSRVRQDLVVLCNPLVLRLVFATNCSGTTRTSHVLMHTEKRDLSVPYRSISRVVLFAMQGIHCFLAT